MMNPTVFAIAVLVVATLSVSALPNGAPICAVSQLGIPAVRAAHVSTATRTVTNGTLAAGTFEVLVNNVVLNASSTLTIDTKRSYSVVVRSTATPARQFRGLHVLLYAAGSNVTGALLPTAPFQVSPNCTSNIPIAGVSHAEPSLKTSFNGTLRLDAAYPSMTLDVNIVVSNTNVTGSVYYFTQYKLASAVAPTKAPTKAPVTAPTAAAAPTVAAAPKAPSAASAPSAAAAPSAPTAGAPTATSKKCGLLGLSIFCPIKRCGILGRLLGLCPN